VNEYSLVCCEVVSRIYNEKRILKLSLVSLNVSSSWNSGEAKESGSHNVFKISSVVSLEVSLYST
jgi:hypothetical protein